MVYEANGIRVVTIGGYLPAIAKQLGALRGVLSKRDSGEPIAPEVLQRLVDSPDSDILAAYKIGENGSTGGPHARVIGMGVLRLSGGLRGNYAQLEDFAVDPELQNNGVGKVMWGAFEQWAVEKGAGEIRLQTEPQSRPGAAAFYERVGAVPLPQKVTYSCGVGQ